MVMIGPCHVRPNSPRGARVFGILCYQVNKIDKYNFYFINCYFSNNTFSNWFAKNKYKLDYGKLFFIQIIMF